VNFVEQIGRKSDFSISERFKLEIVRVDYPSGGGEHYLLLL